MTVVPAASRPRWRPSWRGLALFAAAMLFQAIVLRRYIGWYDESLELYGVEQVLHGHLPYRDFWTLYGPAQFYVLAGFFKLFGTTALTGRLYDALVKAGIAVMLAVLVERLASRRAALIAAAAALLSLTCGTATLYNFPALPALLCGLLSLYLLSRFLETRRLRLLAAAGLVTGLAATFRHDSGFYLCLTVVAVLACGRRSATDNERETPRLALQLAIYLGATLAVGVPVAVWLLAKVPLHDLTYDLFYVPAVIYPRVRALPFPKLAALRPYLHPLGQPTLYALEEWAVYLPIAACATALAVLATARARLWETQWQRLTFAAMALLSALLYLKGIVRVLELHLMPSIAVALALVAVLASRRAYLNAPMRLATFACTTAAAIYLALLLWHAATFTRWNLRDAIRWHGKNSFYTACHPPPGLERTRCLLIEQPTAEAAQLIDRLTAPGDPIYVGAGRHDKLASSDVRLYFVANRGSVTKWYDLHPGVQTTPAIQQEIVASLRGRTPKVVVLNDAWDDIVEPNASAQSSGVTLLDDYLRAHYTPVATIVPYTILVPRPATPQAAGSDSK
jgi:hypothetical protein